MLMNDSTVKLLRKLKDGKVSILLEGLITEEPDTILGHSVITSELCLKLPP
jgi:HK97 family phage major capsid protein